MGTESCNMKEIAKDRRDVLFLECPQTRCNECENFRNGECQIIAQWKEQSKSQARLVIIEMKRGYIHLAPSKRSCVGEPPWITKGWDSAYLGDDLRISSSEIVDMYRVGPYLTYFSKTSDNRTAVHHALPMLKTPLEHSLFEEVCTSLPSIKEERSFKRGHLNKRIQEKRRVVLEHLSEIIPEMDEDTKHRISRIIAHRKSVLSPFFPLLIDEEIEEIYLSRPCSYIYFDHCRLGRCETEVTLEENDVNRFTTLIRAESNFHLDYSNPSLKTEIAFADVLLRVSATIPPLSPDGLSLEIRRARSKPFTIIDLVRNGTLTIDIAAFLISAIYARANITITGEPGSGKTTLLNALDMMAPSKWRKLYIEDAIESRLLNRHKQTRFRVPPYEEREGNLSKRNEIVKCLHRSPDYVILGEIQTAEHSSALFQAIVAGLRTIQTCHSRNSACLISRWRDSHGISEYEIALMDLIVTMKQKEPGVSDRYVAEVAEVARRKRKGLLFFDGLNIIFQNDAKSSDGDSPTLRGKRESETNIRSIEDELESLVDSYHDSWPTMA